MDELTESQWRAKNKEFESEGYMSYNSLEIEEIDAKDFNTRAPEYTPVAWDTPIRMQNPDLLQMIFSLKRKIDKLEESLKDLERKNNEN